MSAAAPICPKCGNPARETVTKHGPRHDCCGLHSWGGKPLVDKDTIEARKAAHVAIDKMCHRTRAKLGQAYKALADELKIPREEFHISKMTKEDCARVIDLAGKMIREPKPKSKRANFIGLNPW